MGRALLVAAFPVWDCAALERLLGGSDPDRLRADLRAVLIREYPVSRPDDDHMAIETSSLRS